MKKKCPLKQVFRWGAWRLRTWRNYWRLPLTNKYILVFNIIQGNSRKGFGRCRLNCFLDYIHYPSIPLHTNSWDDISRALFVNSPVPHRLLSQHHASFYLSTGEFMKRVWEMLAQLFVKIIYTISFIPLHTNSWDDISRTLFVNSPVAHRLLSHHASFYPPIDFDILIYIYVH